MGSSQSSPSSSATNHDDATTPPKRAKPLLDPSTISADKAKEFDKVASELPSVIDEQSRQQVEDYKQACDNGKGPMVACFATGEFLALFEQRHDQAAELYQNVCFRPLSDKSPNGVEVDSSKAYTPGCFNLAKMTMTGKGGVTVDNKAAYQLFDRACRGGHGGACFVQAKLLTQAPGSLGDGVPHDPQRALQLYEQNCLDLGDSMSCFTLATMLLRGEQVSLGATNVSPHEAQGLEPLKQRVNEADRNRKGDQEVFSVPRDTLKAERLLKLACDNGGHPTSCYNLAVMYKVGDEGIPADPEKANVYIQKTQALVSEQGGLGGM